MGITLTLEPDVAALLTRVRRSRKSSLKQVVNEALRHGLRQMSKPPAPGKPYRTRAVSLRRCLIGGLDDVSEALAIAEGESFR